MSFNFYIPTRVLFGANILETLHEQDLPFKKALIVMTNGKSLIKYGYLDRLKAELKKANIESIDFPKVLPNPLKETVMEAADLCKKEGVDLIIGFGGGSAIDSAKAIALMCTNPGDLWDYFDGGTGLNKPFVNRPLPILAITTTAGTGTEADPWFVCTKGIEKIGAGNDWTFPFLAIVDPTLMVSVPSKLTAYQGFDTLFHSMEGYINIRRNPMGDMFAERSIELIANNLEEAVKHGDNLDARANVALANTLGGIVECVSGCTGEHSIEHGLSGFHPNIIHGFGLIAISLAYFEKVLESHSVDDRLLKMARLLGYKEATKPSDFLIALKNLQVKCGVDKLSLKDEGLLESEFEAVAKHTFDTMAGLYSKDPVKWDVDMVVDVLKKSYR